MRDEEVTNSVRLLPVAHCVRKAHPEAFNPKALVLSPLIDLGPEQSDQWTYWFPFKAAAVYYALEGKDADDLNKAETRFAELAQDCFEKISEQATRSGKKPSSPCRSPCSHRIWDLALPVPSSPYDRRSSRDGILSYYQQHTAKTIAEDLPQNIKVMCDAIYLVVVVLNDFKQCSGKDRDSVEAYMVSRHGTQIISDIAMLDNQLPRPLLLEVPKLCGKPDNLAVVLAVFCRYYSPFYASTTNLQTRFPDSTLLDCVHHSLRNPKVAATATGDAVSWPIPPAKELARVGIRFEAVLSGFVNDIRFDGAALQLPALVFDSKMETVLRNLVALEMGKLRRPVTRYLQLLKELVDDVGDVKVLKKCGALRGRWKSDEDVVRFVNEVGGFASFPSTYPAVDAHVGKMKAYYDERRKNFWVRNGPALKLTSSMAAAVSVVAAAVYAVKSKKK